MNEEDKVLSQAEAVLAADFLKSREISLEMGRLTVWKMKPTDISNKYGISLSELLRAIRRHSTEPSDTKNPRRKQYER